MQIGSKCSASALEIEIRGKKKKNPKNLHRSVKNVRGGEGEGVVYYLGFCGNC